MIPIILPQIITARWREACAQPTLQRWRSLGGMCENMADICAQAESDLPMCTDLRTLADVAYQHMRDLQPQRELEAA